MRVIGDASKEIEKKKVCKNCGAELGYLPIDIKEEKHYDYIGDFDINKYIECPRCGKKIYV